MLAIGNVLGIPLQAGGGFLVPAANIKLRNGVAGSSYAFSRNDSDAVVHADELINQVGLEDIRFEGARGVLIEGGSGNAILRAFDLTQAYWGPFGCTISAPAALVFGDFGLQRITEDTSTSGHGVASSGYSVGASQDRVKSVYFRKIPDSSRYFQLSGISIHYDTTPVMLIDIATATVVSVVGVNDYGIEHMFGDIYRAWLTATTKAAPGTAPGFFVNLHNKVGTSYTGDGSSFIDVGLVQEELGKFPTSFIPTTTAALSRNPEVLTLDSSLFPGGVGSMVVSFEFAAPTFATRTAGTVFSLNDSGAGTNALSAVLFTSGKLVVGATSGGTTIGAKITSGVVSAGKHNLALCWDTDLIKAWLDGVLLATLVGGSGTMPATVDRFSIGSDDQSGVDANYLNGWIGHKNIQLFDERLPDATLQRLSQ